MRRPERSTEPRLRYLRHLPLLAVGALPLLLAEPAAAQIFQDPRKVAMAGVRGDPLGNSAVMHNPAGMSRAYLYAASAIYVRDGAGHNVAGVNIVDSKTQPELAVGIAYGYQFTDGDAPIATDGHDVRLSLAHPFTDRIHVGIGLHYLHLERSVPEADDAMDDPDAMADAMDDAMADAVAPKDLTGFTLDAGLLIDVGGGLTLGLVGENLVDLDDPTVPRRAGGGVGYAGESFSFDVDVLADFDSRPDGEPAVVVGAGVEALVSDRLPLRVGYLWDGAAEHSWVGGGVGFITKGSGANGGQISVSFQQNVTDTEQYLVAAGLTLFL